MRRDLCFILLLIMLPLGLWGRGDQDLSGYESVNGLENWDTTLNIADKEEGLYNFVIRGTDVAGNEYIEGPFNIYIDKDSDKPVVNISNPIDGMRVGSALNIVGTCIDDDQVDRVEVQIDEQDFMGAEGGEFWRYYLNVDELDDGAHTVTARGIDVNGVVGDEFAVFFHLDKLKPVNTIESHESGELVFGTFTLEGSVVDANGIEQLEMSNDNRESYSEVRYRYDREMDQYNFSQRIDSREFEDGPHVTWFRSTDGTGSVGDTAFLFFVDNTPPELDILNPGEEADVDGLLTVTGKVYDLIGVESLTYVWGEEEGEIPLTPGDPYWQKTFDLRELDSNRTSVDFTVIDSSGNVITNRVNLNVNIEQDKPVVTIDSPLPDSVNTGELVILGGVSDDDGVASIQYSIDDRDPISRTTEEAFTVNIPGLEEGRHTVRIRGVDIYGVEGDFTEISLFVANENPLISIDEVVDGELNTSYYPGIEISPSRTARLSGSVMTRDALTALSYSLNASEATPISFQAEEGGYGFTINLEEVPYGIIDIDITATDEYDREIEYQSFFYVTNYTKVNETYGFHFIDSRLENFGRIALSSAEPLVGYFHGEAISDIRLEPETDLVRVSSRGQNVEIRPAGQGVTELTQIIVTTDKGHEFRSRSFIFLTDNADPELTVETPEETFWVSESFTLQGSVEDFSGIQSVKYRYDGTSWNTVVLQNNRFDQALFCAMLSDGPHLLEVRAEDTAGNTTTENFTLVKDSQRPGIEFFTPGPEDQLSGTISFSGRITEAGVLDSLAYTLDGITYNELPVSEYFFFEADMSGMNRFPTTFSVRATDVAGNTSYAAPNFGGRNPFTQLVLSPEELEDLDTSPDIETLFPLQGVKLNGQVLVAIRVLNPDQIQSMTFAYGEEEGGAVRVSSGNPYWVHEFDFSQETTTSPRISFEISDKEGNTQTRYVRVSLDSNTDEPQILLSSPLADSTLRGTVAVSGEIRDDDRVRRLHYSIDENEGLSVRTEEVFLLELSNLEGGEHRLTLWGEDNSGVEGPKKTVDFIVADATPTLFFNYLIKGETSLPFNPGMAFVRAEDTAVIEGTLVTSNRIEESYYSMDGEDEARLIPGDPDERGRRSFQVEIDSDLAFGRHSIRVRIVDEYGQTIERESFFYLLDSSDEPVNDSEGIFIRDSRMMGRYIYLTDARQMRAYYFGRDVSSVRIEPENEIVSVSRRGNLLRIFPQNPGILSDSRIIIRTIDGDEVESSPLNFVVDRNAPRISVDSHGNGDWLQGEMFLSGTASDDTELSRVEYSLDGGENYSVLPLEEGQNGNFVYSSVISLSNFEDGSIPVSVRAVDITGKIASVDFTVLKDVVKPIITVITPERGTSINGIITLSGRIFEEGRIDRIEFSDDNEIFEEIGSSSDFSMELNLSAYDDVPENFFIRCFDRSGNYTVTSPILNIISEADKPEVEIQLPTDNEVIRNDFVISGMVFDDDDVSTIYYRLDPPPVLEGEVDQEIDLSAFTRLDGRSNFSIPVRIEDMLDNEHLIEVCAMDINGVLSDVEQRVFRISKKEPEALMLAPSIEDTMKGIIELQGIASDANGIDSIYLSFDNGVSFYKAEGGEEWTYQLDTRVMDDGTYALQFKAVDNYATEGLYSTLINIDNTPPELKLDAPLDGDVVSDNLIINGRIEDNIELRNLHIGIESAEEEEGEGEHQSISLDLLEQGAFLETIDVSGFSPGWYNIRLEAQDTASNFSYVSRNFLVEEQVAADRVYIQFPSDGAQISGPFTISGRIDSETNTYRNAILLVDDSVLSTVRIDDNGYFSYEVEAGHLDDGEHIITARVSTGSDSAILSDPCPLHYRAEGPWIRIANFIQGAFINNRPWLEGSTGYYLGAEPEDEEERRAYEEAQRTHRLEQIDISFDNGKTFEPVQRRENWRFRLETQNFSDGTLTVMLRALYSGGETAVVKTVLNLDKVAPDVTLLTEAEGGTYNEEISLTGTAFDMNGLSDVMINLREGDKSSYSVPEFIQGLYMDVHFLGATDFDLGLGLTFFDDVVRVQVSAGMSEYNEAQRFSGFSTGLKILANVAQFPFSFFFGPDWDFFSMSLTIGAQFSYFSQSQEIKFNLDEGVVIGAIISQLEFAKFTIEDWDFCNAIGFYFAPEFWFISSDVQATIVAGGTIGFRIDLL